MIAVTWTIPKEKQPHFEWEPESRPYVYAHLRRIFRPVDGLEFDIRGIDGVLLTIAVAVVSGTNCDTCRMTAKVCADGMVHRRDIALARGPGTSR